MYHVTPCKKYAHHIVKIVFLLVAIHAFSISLYAQKMIDSSYFRNSIPESGLMTDFETEPRGQLTPGTRWYAFTDGKSFDCSKIENGVFKSDPDCSGECEFSFREDMGYGGEGFAPYCTLTIGRGHVLSREPFEDYFCKGFAGICCDLSDSRSFRSFDLIKHLSSPADSTAGVFFSYCFDGDSVYLFVEVLDTGNDPDFTRGKQSDLYYSGVWCKWLPPTGNEWKHVEIPFTSLDIKRFSNPIPSLNLQRLTKIRFTLTGEKYKRGMLAIDNFCFTGTDTRTPVVNQSGAYRRPVTFSATLRGRRLTIHYTSNSLFQGACSIAQLFDLKGTLLRTIHLNPAGSEDISVPLCERADGQYLLRYTSHTNKSSVSSGCVPVGLFR